MIGQTVGKYRVEARIGRGGMGTVYRAVDETLRREVAIKVLNSELNDPEVAKRFRAEAITVARLNHGGIATVYELFEHDGQWLMVMEFVRGETLERLIERAGPLTAERAADLCMQTLTALTHAHSLGVVHRDLKPANLMLTDAGAVKIMDFGIARVSGAEHLTNAGFMMGTPAYMAPEQVLGHEVDARTDLYALGVVLYRLTTGKLPFKGETPFALAQSQVNDPPTPLRTAREGLPAWLEQILTRALAKSPVERFQTAFEFREGLQRALAGLPVESHFDAAGETGMLQAPASLPSGAFGIASAGASGAIPASGASGAVPFAGAPAGSASGASALPAAGGGTAAVSAGTSGTFSQASAAGPAPAAKPAAKKSSSRLIAIAAGVVVLAAAGVFVARGFLETAAPAQPAITTAAPEPQPGTPPTAGGTSADATAAGSAASGAAGGAGGAGQPPPTSPAPAASSPPGQPAGTSGVAAGTAATAATPGAAGTPVQGSAPSSSGGAAVPTTPGGRADAGRAAGRAAAPETTDALIVFSDAKFLTFDGRKGRDQEVILHFGSGQFSVIPKKGGAALVAIPYTRIAHATYSHTKDPKWDPSLSGLPENPDIPGFMRGSRHWLVLQWKTDSVCVYLSDSTSAEILHTFEARTGLKIDRPSESGK